jgi:cytosine/creatinine deaminase
VMIPTGFAAVPDVPAFRLVNARAPLCVVEGAVLAGDRDGLTRIDLTISGGKIASILPAGLDTLDGDLPALDLKGGIVLPRFVDVHTHLDKGHIWPRRRNPDGTFIGALENVMADREANWSAADLEARMEFGLQCAFAHGTAAVRTHLDSIGPQIGISWPVFERVRARWAGRIALQATPLFGIQHALLPQHMADVIKAVKAHGSGLLGCVTYMIPEIHAALDIMFRAAVDNGLDLDFHVDETNDPAARTLEFIADTALRFGFKGKILAGHCCSLSLQTPEDEARIVAKVRAAGIAVVSLAMCNMYLQDRAPDRTPRWRGVTSLHELKAAGVAVMVASDNTRDPFYAYGDLDMIEVWREATRILQLDHGAGDWARAVTSTPATIMEIDAGMIRVGGAADLVITRGRSLTEFFARPQADRTVLVAGKAIETTLPDYAVLDAHVGGPG